MTVLANMAANSICRAEIHAVDGVEFLARMLETKAVDEGVLTPAELAAAERVQKKAAIALSRFVWGSYLYVGVKQRKYFAR